ncbi:zinc-binding dehydrogenase [Streptomyces sp. NRRL F-2580]|uniref:zinc-binding dehydrogenase n=1 Tax=Streptomyces sp. NRRL F-2580 TaxID=1463841 RepID=UPI00068E83F2
MHTYYVQSPRASDPGQGLPDGPTHGVGFPQPHTIRRQRYGSSWARRRQPWADRAAGPGTRRARRHRRRCLIYGAGDVRVENVPDPRIQQPTDALAVRVPQAVGTLVKLPVGEDSALLPSLLTLSDVFPTGHHCAVTASVNERTTVTVIGDGAVGLSAVLAAKRLGAERITLMGRHKDRTDLGRAFGATDIVAERGAEGIEKVRALTGGDGTHTVLECVGPEPPWTPPSASSAPAAPSPAWVPPSTPR